MVLIQSSETESITHMPSYNRGRRDASTEIYKILIGKELEWKGKDEDMKKIKKIGGIQ